MADSQQQEEGDEEREVNQVAAADEADVQVLEMRIGRQHAHCAVAHFEQPQAE